MESIVEFFDITASIARLFIAFFFIFLAWSEKKKPVHPSFGQFPMWVYIGIAAILLGLD